MTRIGVALMLGALAACGVTDPGGEPAEDVAVQEATIAFQYGYWNGQPAPLDEHSMQVVVRAPNYYLAAVVDTKAFQITWGVKLSNQQVPTYMAVNALGPIGPCWNGGISVDCDKFIKSVGTNTMQMLLNY